MRSRKRGIAALAAAGMCMLALAGCSETPTQEPISTSTVVLAADGSFTRCQVEAFAGEDYLLDELESMIRQEVQDYLGGGAGDGSAVAVEQVSALEGSKEQAMVALRFADSRVYEDYRAQVDQQPCRLFYGTVQEALAEGYDLEGALQDMKKGTPLTSEQLAKIGDKRVLVFEEALQIRCPSKVLYTSGNVKLTEAGYVDGTEGEGLKYVVIK